MVEVGDRSKGAHRIYGGGCASSLFLNVKRHVETSTYSVRQLRGLRDRTLAEEPVSPTGWAAIWRVFAAEEPEYVQQLFEREKRRSKQRARQEIWDGLSTHEIDLPLRSAFLVGGFGIGPFEKGKAHSLRFGDSALVISLPDVAIETVPYSDLDCLNVSGEVETRGGRFIGGGLGIEGAAEGMLVAAVLNSLTAKTDVRTIIEVQTKRNTHFVFLNTAKPAKILEVELLPVQARLRGIDRLSGRTGDGANLIEQLERLAALHRDGALSAEEFQSAKSRLLLTPRGV